MFKPTLSTAAFIGMVAGLCVCICVALMFTCLKRRSYSTPNGPGGMWTIPQDPVSTSLPLHLALFSPLAWGMGEKVFVSL